MLTPYDRYDHPTILPLRPISHQCRAQKGRFPLIIIVIIVIILLLSSLSSSFIIIDIMVVVFVIDDHNDNHEWTNSHLITIFTTHMKVRNSLLNIQIELFFQYNNVSPVHIL